MKCPDCGAWTKVLETRTRSSGESRRRYVCANEHRFTTLEMVVSVSPVTRPVGGRPDQPLKLPTPVVTPLRY